MSDDPAIYAVLQAIRHHDGDWTSHVAEKYGALVRLNISHDFSTDMRRGAAKFVWDGDGKHVVVTSYFIESSPIGLVHWENATMLVIGPYRLSLVEKLPNSAFVMERV